VLSSFRTRPEDYTTIRSVELLKRFGVLGRKTFISSPQLTEPDSRLGFRHVTGLLNSVSVWWIVSLLGAGLYAWVDRHAMNPDGMSYLDMALATLRSGPGNLINGYWSPLYSVLIGGAVLILRPTPGALFPVVHLVNFLVFVITLFCFTFFVRSWAAIQENDSARAQLRTTHLIAFSFGLFFWFTEEFTRPSIEHPDSCVTAVVFLVAGLCCRIRAGGQWRYFFGLGLALGLGYYAKAVMFPLALILLVVLLALPPLGKIVRLKVASAALVFFIVSAPLVTRVSKRVGHLSSGEAGPIAYAFYVNGLPVPPSWTAGVNGAPKHPPRIVSGDPLIMEFSSPVKGTDPLGYDPSYWFAGARPYFNLRQQFAALKVNLRIYLSFLYEMVALLSGALMLYVLSPRGSLSRRPGILFWWFTVWPIAACVLYALVHVEARFLPGFFILFWLALCNFLWQKVDPGAKTAVLGMVMFALLVPTLKDLVKASAGHTTDQPEYIRVGEALRDMGVGPGDSIATAGGSVYETGGRVYRQSNAWDAYYARYIGARVIAAIVDADDGIDMPQRLAPAFWHVDEQHLARAKDVLAGIGVKAIVAWGRPADSTAPADWHPVSGTPDSIMLVNPPGSENPISENGSWTNGAADGLDWANVRALRGVAIGAQPEFAPVYADSTALLTGTWGPEQMVEATVHSLHQKSSETQEVELRLRSTMSPHRSTGYAVTFRCLHTSEAYAGIARWNGALGSFTALAFFKGTRYGVRDGDVIKATIIGNLIRGYINDVQVVQATDDTYKEGRPGIGFYIQGGPSLDQSDFGFTSFKATDGKRTTFTTFRSER